MDANITKFGAGQILCKEGEKTTDLYFIRSGELDILVRDQETGEDVKVGSMSKGSVAGIMSFMEGEPRNATLKAVTDVEVTMIKSMQREKLLKDVPVWFKALLKQLSGDVKRINQSLLKLNEEHKMLEKRYKALKSKVGDETEE